jgi:hypothetical protein
LDVSSRPHRDRKKAFATSLMDLGAEHGSNQHA